jgi:hypothetical protein
VGTGICPKCDRTIARDGDVWRDGGNLCFQFLLDRDLERAGIEPFEEGVSGLGCYAYRLYEALTETCNTIEVELQYLPPEHQEHLRASLTHWRGILTELERK